MYCGSVIVVCQYLGSIVDVYGILKSCGGVMVVCGELRKCSKCVWSFEEEMWKCYSGS